MIKKILLSPATAIFTLILVLGIRVSDPTFVESVRLNYFDTLITSAEPVQNNIYTVNIDEDSLEQYGQWPFPRDVYADIIEDLYARNAGLVVFNVLMAEQDRSGQDQVLMDTLSQYPVILPNIPSIESRNTPRQTGAAILNPEYLYTVLQYPGIIANLEQYEQLAIGTGIVNTLPEIDGVNRRIPLVASVNDVLYPALSLEVLRVVAGDISFQIRLSPLGVDKMRIPQFGPITTDSFGRIWIDWSQKSIPAGLTELPEDFGGALVIVSPTAAGISNPVPSSIGAVHPHELQASVIGTMFNGVNIQRPDYADLLELSTMLVVGLLIILLSRFTYVGLGTIIVLVVATVPVSHYLYDTYKMLFDASALIVGIVLVGLHTYGVKFVSEFLQKQAIKKQFEGYASPAVVKLLQENPEIVKQGIKKEVSICFSDLRGFTPLGESFGDDVKGLTEIMNGYMDAITQPVLDNNGMIIKYIGDASMHIHNAPLDDPNHAATAVKTGLQMLRAVEKFNQDVVIPQGRPPVGMGAGINTGLGYIGEMGSTKRHSYDVLGDAVSTTARIESKCKEYGCLLLVGENTVKQCGDEFFFLKIDDLAVKGKSVGVGIYTVLEKMHDTYVWKERCHVRSKNLHDKMHELYRKQDFKGAIKLLEELRGHFDGKMNDYYVMWEERCKYMMTQKLPKDWNGVFVATSK